MNQTKTDIQNYQEFILKIIETRKGWKPHKLDFDKNLQKIIEARKRRELNKLDFYKNLTLPRCRCGPNDYLITSPPFTPALSDQDLAIKKIRLGNQKLAEYLKKSKTLI